MGSRRWLKNPGIIENMPTRKYILERGGTQRLEISWKILWKNITIRLEGKEIGSIKNQKELLAGRDFSLNDGSILKVKLIQGFSPELQVTRDGQPLPGSDSDPFQRLSLAYKMVLFIGWLNVVLWLIAELLKVGFLQRFGFGFGSIIVGIIFLILGFFMKRKSKYALLIAIILFFGDGILAAFFLSEQARNYVTGGIVARIFLLIPMIQGVSAI
jgi:hypothetical protein